MQVKEILDKDIIDDMVEEFAKGNFTTKEDVYKVLARALIRQELRKLLPQFFKAPQ